VLARNRANYLVAGNPQRDHGLHLAFGREQLEEIPIQPQRLNLLLQQRDLVHSTELHTVTDVD
jgi:hypothetical protein